MRLKEQTEDDDKGKRRLREGKDLNLRCFKTIRPDTRVKRKQAKKREDIQLISETLMVKILSLQIIIMIQVFVVIVVILGK